MVKRHLISPPPASRRSISARLTCWHVLHFLDITQHQLDLKPN
jgi:hypothetical protein